MRIKLKKIVPILTYQSKLDETIIVVSHDKLIFSINCLKFHIGYQYNLLVCISGVDFIGKGYRFSVVYDFLSLQYNIRLRIKTFINEITEVPSITNIFVNANWWEREIWDMYGIYFYNHTDLRRILTDYGFEGNPMKKDFPLSGFLELKYDESKKRIIVEPIELTQKFRFFIFETPWS